MRFVAAIAAFALPIGLVVFDGPDAIKAAEIRSVSGIVFFDRNLNGMRDVGESGAPGRTVEVMDSVEDTVYRGESSEDGRYEITGLSSDRGYLVYLATDEETPCGDTSRRPLEPDTDWSQVDLAVIHGDGEISGAVVNDANENGRRDPGESGWEGWNVLLQGTPEGMGGCSAEVTSDARGQFRFRGLPQGPYWLLADPPEGSGSMIWEYTYPTRADEIYPQLQTVVFGVDLLDGATSAYREFGVHELRGEGTISVSTFIDKNANEVRDPGEPLAECWRSGPIDLYRAIPGVGLVPVMFPGNPICSEGVSSLAGLPAGTYGLWYPWWCSTPEQPGPPSNPDVPTFATVELVAGGAVLFEHGRCASDWVEIATPTPIPPPAIATLPPEITVMAPDVGEGTAQTSGATALRLILIVASSGAAICGATLVWRLHRTRKA